MNRLFQHYSGSINALTGLRTYKLKYLSDNEDRDVILFWMKAENKWLRIFIDGAYCGVDEYDFDESGRDEEVGVTLINQDDWVNGLKIKSAQVTSGTLPTIILNITFTNETQLVLTCNEKEYCVLNKVG